VYQSLFAVIMEVSLYGTCTCKVDDLVKALGADSGISKSEVSRICADLDAEVAVFRDRSALRSLWRPAAAPGPAPTHRRSDPVVGREPAQHLVRPEIHTEIHTGIHKVVVGDRAPNSRANTRTSS
jgi:hypothetical protein